MIDKDTDRPAPETPGPVWPPAPQVPPPEPPTPPRKPTLMENAWLDAALGMLIGVVASVLLVAAIGFMYPPPDIGRKWVVTLSITTLVNMAACLAIGRRFRIFAVAMAVASSATVAALLWYVVLTLYGTDWW